MIVTKTPFRISFFGGGSDYPAWYCKHRGTVLSTTIDKYCYIVCRYLPSFFDHKSRIVYSRIELVNSHEEIQHPSIRACLKFLNVEKGVEIHHNADLPARSGIGSSSAFTVGLLNALYALKQEKVSTETLASNAIHIEQELIKESVGSQDQIAAAYGGLNFIEFLGPKKISITPLVLEQERLKELHSHLILIFTSLSRNASDIAAEQIKNIPYREAELKLIQQMVDEGIAILKSSGNIDEFGKLLHEAWILKRTLSNRITTPIIDEIYTVARSEGVIGGKLLGAGSGGFFLLFAKPEYHLRIIEKLKTFLHVPFEFESQGSLVIF